MLTADIDRCEQSAVKKCPAGFPDVSHILPDISIVLRRDPESQNKYHRNVDHERSCE